LVSCFDRRSTHALRYEPVFLGLLTNSAFPRVHVPGVRSLPPVVKVLGDLDLTPYRDKKDFARLRRLVRIAANLRARAGDGRARSMLYPSPSRPDRPGAGVACRRGEKRPACRVLSIGRALLLNPKLLILDEPSQGLAPLIVREVFQIVAQMRSEGLVRRRGVLALVRFRHGSRPVSAIAPRTEGG